MMLKNKSKFISIGVKVGFLVVCVLIAVMGIKSAIQTKNNFNSAILQGEKLKLEETKNLANELEKRFIKAHRLGLSIQANVQNTIFQIPKENRKRELVIDNMVALFGIETDVVRE